jgi:hypothetical protein
MHTTTIFTEKEQTLMRYWTRCLSLSLLVCVSFIILIGCDTSSNPSDNNHRLWMLTWISSTSAQQSNSPETAFVTSAYVQRPDGTLTKPASTTWLATSSDFGLVLVHLDPSGQYVSIGIVELDSSTHQWVLRASFVDARPTTGNGIPAAQQERAWTLPPGTYQSGGMNISDKPPEGFVRLWMSDTNQVIALAHVFSVIQRPISGTSSVTSNGKTGWLAEQQGMTLVVVKLDEGMLVFGGTTDPTQSQHLVAQAMANLDSFFN